MQLNPYLNFPGNTEEAFNFYKSVFGGEFVMVMRFRDTEEASRVSEADLDKIMHIALPVGGNIIMGTDALESAGQTLVNGTNFHLCISAENDKEADKVYAALSAGGKTTMPMSKTFWGSYFGMCEDKFGIQWMIDFDDRVKR